MTPYQRANQLADQIESLPYKEIVYGLFFSLAFFIGFAVYLFANDSWNLHYCLGGL